VPIVGAEHIVLSDMKYLLTKYKISV